MPPKINPNEIQWDAAPSINAGEVQWDNAPSQQEPMTDREAWESSLPVRILRGFEAPAITLMKMIGPDSIRKQLAEIDQLRESGMKKQGNEGFDWGGLVGGLGSGLAVGGPLGKAATAALGPVAGGVATGAAMSAAQPLPGDNELSMDKIKQAGVGGAMGAAFPLAAKAVKGFMGSNQLNPTQQATLREGQQAGYTVPPSIVNPSGLNNTLESIAGKAAVGQEASSRNSKVTAALTARMLGLQKGDDVSRDAIHAARQSADTVFDEVANLSPTAKTALRELRDSRNKAGKYFDEYFRTKGVTALEQAEYHKGLAKLFEQEIESEAQKAGRPALVKSLQDARKKIAQTYDIERAFNEADGSVSAPKIGAAFTKKTGKAVTDELATIGKMAKAFPSVMREGAKVPVAGVSGTDAAMSAILGMGGYGVGGPFGVMAAALPQVARPIARKMALSPTYQKYLAEGMSPQTAALMDALARKAGTMGAVGVGQAQ